MNKRFLKSQQSGFTLIELVVVIVILGILAATALPKFINLQTDARFATLKAAEGALSSTAAIAHAKFLVASSAPATLDGTAVIWVNGYPSAATIGALAGITTASGYNADSATTVGTLAVNPTGAVTVATCKVTYLEATSTVPPVITLVGDGTTC